MGWIFLAWTSCQCTHFYDMQQIPAFNVPLSLSNICLSLNGVAQNQRLVPCLESRLQIRRASSEKLRHESTRRNLHPVVSPWKFNHQLKTCSRSTSCKSTTAITEALHVVYKTEALASFSPKIVDHFTLQIFQERATQRPMFAWLSDAMLEDPKCTLEM